jgi:hypothetical protein
VRLRGCNDGIQRDESDPLIDPERSESISKHLERSEECAHLTNSRNQGRRAPLQRLEGDEKTSHAGCWTAQIPAKGCKKSAEVFEVPDFLTVLCLPAPLVSKPSGQRTNYVQAHQIHPDRVRRKTMVVVVQAQDVRGERHCNEDGSG